MASSDSIVEENLTLEDAIKLQNSHECDSDAYSTFYIKKQQKKKNQIREEKLKRILKEI